MGGFGGFNEKKNKKQKQSKGNKPQGSFSSKPVFVMPQLIKKDKNED